MKADSGKSHTVVMTDDGQAFAFGWNKHGQLGTGSLRNGRIHCAFNNQGTFVGVG